MKDIILATMAVLPLVLLGLCVALAVRNRGLTFLANGVADGTHKASLTLLSSAAVGTRNLVGAIGADAAHVAVAGASDVPLGLITDEAAAAEEPVNVELFGVGERTLVGVASAAIALGAFVVPAANGKLRTLPTAAGTYHIVGRAIAAASGDNDTFEFVPCFPIQRVVS